MPHVVEVILDLSLQPVCQQLAGVQLVPRQALRFLYAEPSLTVGERSLAGKSAKVRVVNLGRIRHLLLPD